MRLARPVLVVAAIGHLSWVEVVAPDRHVLFQGELQPGRPLSFSAHPLSLLLADPGAVQVVVRGQARRLAGRHGQLLVLRIG